MIGLARSSLQYRSAPRNDDALRLAIIRLAKQYGRYGYPLAGRRLRSTTPRGTRSLICFRSRAGGSITVEGGRGPGGAAKAPKTVERPWREEGLQLPQRHKKRKRLYHKYSSIIRLRPTHPNDVWAIDFVHDKLSNGRSYKMLTVLVEFTRQALAVVVRTKMGADDVLETLYPLLLRHGSPEHIRSDNVLCREYFAA